MTPSYSEYHKIRHHQAGPTGRLRLAPLFDFMQDAAAMHADELGCGLAFLHRHQMLWVLARIRLAITRMPGIGETIKVLTYPTGGDRLFALRQYTITGADDTPIARGTSYWLILKSSNYHPLRPAAVLERQLPSNDDMPRHFFPIDKLPEIPPEQAIVRQQTIIRPSLLDVNRHLNNAWYAAFATDVAAELAPDRNPVDIQVNFQHAAMPGDTVFSGGIWEDPNTLLIDGRSGNGKTCYYQARIVL